MKKYLALDIGGSAIKYALIQEDLTFLEKSTLPTPLDGMDHFVEVIGELYDRYASEIKGIAISMPGIIDPERGYNYTGGALHYIVNTETVSILQKRCPVPITIGNDAKCAANAEVGFGNLKDVQDGAVVILGTGIGGCIVKDHQVHIGRHFSAGEFSSIKTNCLEPNNVKWTWAVRNGIVGLLSRVQEALETDEKMTGYEIFEMANQGNEKVLGAIDQFAKEAAIQMFNIHTIFDCERIVVGGGISAQPLLIELIQKHFDAIFDHLGFNMPKPEIAPCFFRNDANLIGALYQHMQTFN